MFNTPDSPAKTPGGYTTQGGNFWTLITPEIWKVLHAVLHLGIQAQGRTTILKINYRNTQEVPELASGIARELLKPSASDEDGVPLVAPISAGRHGPNPLLIKLPSIQQEADYIANHLKEAHKTGIPWSDIAVIYHDYGIGKLPPLVAISILSQYSISTDKEMTQNLMVLGPILQNIINPGLPA
jgi:hypothetical protein